MRKMVIKIDIDILNVENKHNLKKTYVTLFDINIAANKTH